MQQKGNKGMQEIIGNISLDYTWYPGEDLYSDGAIEDEMLEIAKTVPEEKLSEVIREKKSWPMLYHFSHIRENILDWVPMKGTEKVLEIGAGCGAVTGVLARKAAEVTCIDLSKKRSQINAYRHQNAKNIRILVGNFQDIEQNLEELYDCITLIGVFEYSEGYIGGKEPYVEMLRRIRGHLKPGGKIYLAIENRLGLKYWAGCTEDHIGSYFEGIEGYTTSSGVRTFSKTELSDLITRAGGLKTEFYYPYPDYKLPMMIYSDDYLPKTGELCNVRYNFDRERLVLFDETKAYDSLIRDGLFELYSNSYLAVIERV